MFAADSAKSALACVFSTVRVPLPIRYPTVSVAPSLTPPIRPTRYCTRVIARPFEFGWNDGLASDAVPPVLSSVNRRMPFAFSNTPPDTFQAGSFCPSAVTASSVVTLAASCTVSVYNVGPFAVTRLSNCSVSAVQRAPFSPHTSNWKYFAPLAAWYVAPCIPPSSDMYRRLMADQSWPSGTLLARSVHFTLSPVMAVSPDDPTLHALISVASIPFSPVFVDQLAGLALVDHSHDASAPKST